MTPRCSTTAPARKTGFGFDEIMRSPDHGRFRAGTTDQPGRDARQTSAEPLPARRPPPGRCPAAPAFGAGDGLKRRYGVSDVGLNAAGTGGRAASEASEAMRARTS